LDREAAERALLAAEVEALRAEVDTLRLTLAAAEGGEPSPAASQRPPADRKGAHSPRGSKAWFDDEGLEQAGFMASDIARLRERWEKFELDKLYLADQAAREGHAGKSGQRGAMKTLQESFRSDIGEEGYDAYLYATGQTNRVIASEVLQDSPAMIAGLERGDVLLRYESEPIYRPRELQLASRQGTQDDVVRIQVLRGGRILTFTLARGPLGIRMEASRMAPKPW
jgi:hypothetical protein